MPVKKLEIGGLGTISLYKRSGTRNIRLTIGPGGNVRVTLPKWVPYNAGLEFVKARREWILSHQPAAQAGLQDGDHIGKAHRLKFIESTSNIVRTNVTKNEIRVTYPANMDVADKLVQEAAKKACVRALKKQAEQLLPMRVEHLAAQHGFSYRGIRVKQLRSRWGSCNNMQELVFNLYLVQLPWPLIDYVVLHELQHTTVMKHGPAFWKAMQQNLPNVVELRKTIKSEQPTLKPQRIVMQAPQD